MSTSRATVSPDFTIRSLALTVYLPTLLFAVGQGAVIPVVAVAARDLGASLAVAGLVAALRGMGVLAFDVPAGWLVGRFGERRAMTAATVMVAVALAGSALAPTVFLLGAFTFLMGCAWSVWLLARLSYVTEAVPVQMRGRALSTLGGINRVGNFIGPIAGIGAIAMLGTDGAYVLHLLTAVGALVLLWLLARGADAGVAVELGGHGGLVTILRQNRGVFLTAGGGVVCIQVLRAARQVVLPLWAVHIGLDVSQVSLIFGISVGMEMLLFYPAGSVMDRLGRKWVALPCLGIMSAGMLALPLSDGFAGLAVVGLVIGFGNGLGSGIVMTLGADFSPGSGGRRSWGRGGLWATSGRPAGRSW